MEGSPKLQHVNSGVFRIAKSTLTLLPLACLYCFGLTAGTTRDATQNRSPCTRDNKDAMSPGYVYGYGIYRGEKTLFEISAT